MLPTEPKSQLTVSQANKSMSNSLYRAFSNNSMRQFANRTGSLIIKNPFWVLVIGSLGIHAAFALITANPFKKAEPPREVIVSTVPIVKLPSRSLPTNSKSNKSLFDNLFVKPSPNKLGVSPNSLPNSFPNSFANSFPSTSLSSLDLTALDRLEDDLLPPIATNNFPLEVPPLLNNPRDIDPPQFVNPQTRISVNQTPPASSRFAPSGQLDNTTPLKTAANSSNLRPEFQSSGLKNVPSTPSSSTEAKNTRDNLRDPRTIQGSLPSNLDNSDRDEKEIGNISSLYTTDKQIIDLVAKNLIRTTQIAPDEAMVSNPELNREKGIVWIAPKVTNISGKRGSVTFMWLVAPDGEVQAKFLKSSGNKELDDIARETVKEYKFRPIEDPQSGKYRLVTAKYNFPYSALR